VYKEESAKKFLEHNKQSQAKLYQTVSPNAKSSKIKIPTAPFSVSPLKLKDEPAYSPALISTLRAPMNLHEYTPKASKYNWSGKQQY
jgi:hypothetical protein